jgi:uncharacterized alkaline shock family protein YloU
MRADESRTDFGTIKIHKNVIASIAAIAAEEIDGIKRVGGQTLASGIMDLIGRRYQRVIKVDIDKNDDVRLQVPVIIAYDSNIPEVAQRVQENIRTALEKMTSLSVREITINVQGIEKGSHP